MLLVVCVCVCLSVVFCVCAFVYVCEFSLIFRIMCIEMSTSNGETFSRR